jgi:hypothetical protein
MHTATHTNFARAFGADKVLTANAPTEHEQFTIENHIIALTDVLLLSMTNKMFAPECSTFSYVANAMANSPPIMVSTDSATCRQAISASPFMHLWYRIKDICDAQNPLQLHPTIFRDECCGCRA